MPRRNTEEIGSLSSERKVMTLYGERGADFKEPDGDIDSVLRGYASMNAAVMHLFKKATVHSVSYSNVVIPELYMRRMWLFATVVYSGEPLPREVDEEEYEGMAEDTMRRVYL